MSLRISSIYGMEEKQRNIIRCKLYQKNLYKHNQFIYRNRENMSMPKSFIWKCNKIFPMWRGQLHVNAPENILHLQLIHRIFNNNLPLGRDYTMFNNMQDHVCAIWADLETIIARHCFLDQIKPACCQLATPGIENKLHKESSAINTTCLTKLLKGKLCITINPYVPQRNNYFSWFRTCLSAPLYHDIILVSLLLQPQTSTFESFN